MRKRFSLIIVLFVSVGASAREQTDSLRIKSLVQKLSWKTISIQCAATSPHLTHDDSSEQSLVQIGKPATQSLIAALRDSTKTVISHIILSRIWNDTNDREQFSTKYIYRNCNQLIGWHHTYNGLVWEWLSGKGNTIDEARVRKIVEYWTTKTSSSSNAATDFASVYSGLDSQDHIQYPCNKIYANNAVGWKYSELSPLFGKKIHDPLFAKMWGVLGNDSTEYYFKDCFFVSYVVEGLSFRFEKDSILSTIFIEETYKGELPFGLTPADSRQIVERKIGKPDKKNRYGDNTANYYLTRRLGLDYDKNGKIIKFGLYHVL